MGLFTSKAERERERDQRMRGFIRSLDRKEQQILRNLDELKALAIEAKRIEDEGRFAMVKVRYQQTQLRRKMIERMRLQVKMLLQDRQMAQVFGEFCSSMRDFATSMRDVFTDVDLAQATSDFNRGMEAMEQQGAQLEDALNEVDARFSDGRQLEHMGDDELDRLVGEELLEKERHGGLSARIDDDLRALQADLDR